MSDPGSTGTENSASSKKKVSPARNVVGIVVLVAVVIAGWFQYSAVFAYNRALKALDARTQDEEKGLMDVPEAESLVGKPADGPGSDFLEGTRTFTQTKYTWRGPLKSYTLTAYYTKGPGPCLHHFEPDGTKYVTEPVVVPPPIEAVATAPAPQKSKGKMKRPRAPDAGQSKTKTAADGKASPPDPAVEAPKPAATANPALVKPAEPVVEAAKPPVTTSPIPAKQPE
jgi:hypothetical protein